MTEDEVFDNDDAQNRADDPQINDDVEFVIDEWEHPRRDCIPKPYQFFHCLEVPCTRSRFLNRLLPAGLEDLEQGRPPSIARHFQAPFDTGNRNNQISTWVRHFHIR